jgi:hypothetical protein
MALITRLRVTKHPVEECGEHGRDSVRHGGQAPAVPRIMFRTGTIEYLYPTGLRLDEQLELSSSFTHRRDMRAALVAKSLARAESQKPTR